ncbi:putative membrane protein [Verticillium dahliae VDG2]|nr:putative membrane protein [Verticillium dahliae VDG2]
MPVRSTVNACTKPFMSPDSITYLGLTHSGAYTRPTAAKTDTQPSGSPSSSASSDDLATGPTGAEYFPHRPKSLAGIALRAFLLGAALSVSALGAVVLPAPYWRLPFFTAALSLFHFLEFWTTAAYNTPEADVKAFLLTANWPAYAIAHAVAVADFNHTVQHRRAASHALVTSGVYAWFRHPSYFGFFWWAVGTQLVLGNVLSLAGYAFVLWKFFSGRIRHEEELLVRFFGREYEEYRRRVGTRMPFCG